MEPENIEHVDRAALLSNLSHRLFARYRISGDLEDLEQAIQRAEEAVAATPLDHINRIKILIGLASHLTSRYERTGDRQDFHYILRTLYSAWHCHTSPPLARVDAARKLSLLLASKKMWQEASSILADAVKLLSKVSTRAIRRTDQEHRLSRKELLWLASDAVSLALQAGDDASTCLRLLEHGRGVIMGLIIDCRNDLSDLEEKYQEVSERFRTFRREIDTSFVGIESAITAEGNDATDFNFDNISITIRDRRQLVAEQLDQTLDSIRQLPGFEGFQLPPSVDSLMAMASEGPVVVVNTTDFRSDAIIITCSSIKTLRLSDLVFEEAEKRMWELRTLVVGAASTYRTRNRRLSQTLKWLWDVAVGPVCQALQLAPVTEELLPHVWWIGVGPLAIAPFHAAGDHRPESTDNTISRAVSSYIPTIKALSYAREKKLNLQDPRVLLIAMPTTPGTGWGPLSNASHEVATIVSLVEGKAHTMTLDRPSVVQVLAELPTHDIIHFACHGVSDSKHPSNSALLLQPENELLIAEPDKLTVERISSVNIQRAQIAYLSACSTAENTTESLADESIYIASGFQLAGFSHVLATRWVSRDDVCLQVAEDFYRSLFHGQVSEGGRRKVRASFHSAVKKLRDGKLKQPILWASFIHTGA